MVHYVHVNYVSPKHRHVHDILIHMYIISEPCIYMHAFERLVTFW